MSFILASAVDAKNGTTASATTALPTNINCLIAFSFAGVCPQGQTAPGTVSEWVKAELAAVLAITKRRFCSSKNDTTGHGWGKAGLSSRTRQLFTPLFTPARFFVSNGTLKFQKAIAP
ncbi:MAG: hypothetical protein WBZ25_28660, partial [Pseudolabrys sp.]